MITSFCSGPVTGTGDGLPAADPGAETEPEEETGAEDAAAETVGEGGADAVGPSDTLTVTTDSSGGSAAFPSSPAEQPARASAAAVHTITELRVSTSSSLKVVSL
ncbi:hypothetical protein ACFW91_14785 [Streptomyces asoensis]|uniref:hypothetical protein n=1 Tax=Streptomyces asoensis TaxID=249586 RepID=UPI00368BEBAA